MKEVQAGRLRVLVEKAGVPMVGIISADEFQRLIAERGARFEAVDRIRSRVPVVPDTEIDQDVREATKAVRTCPPHPGRGTLFLAVQVEEGELWFAAADRAPPARGRLLDQFCGASQTGPLLLYHWINFRGAGQGYG